MSIHRVSATEWQHEFPVGDWNEHHSIEATKEGLAIDYDIISWEDIEKAKEAAREMKF